MSQQTDVFGLNSEINDLFGFKERKKGFGLNQKQHKDTAQQLFSLQPGALLK